jgi:hypothetical protein
MEDLAKHLKDGDFEAAWQCFKDAQGIADKAEDEETSPAAEEDDMPVPGGHGGGHAALLLMPRGK